MNTAVQATSSRRARLNRLRWWWARRLGTPGLLSIVLLVVAAVLAWAVRPAISEAHVALLRAHVAKLDARDRTRAQTPVADARDPRDQARDAWPGVSRRGESVATLLKLLETSGVAADRAEYTAEDMEPGVTRLRITVPVQGGYRSTRGLVASVLNAMPHAALDSIELARSTQADEGLSGNLRFSLFFRREAP